MAHPHSKFNLYFLKDAESFQQWNRSLFAFLKANNGEQHLRPDFEPRTAKEFRVDQSTINLIHGTLSP